MEAFIERKKWRGLKLTVAEHIWTTLESPTSSAYALVLACFLSLFTVTSVIIYMNDTVIKTSTPVIDVVFCTVFALETVFRLGCAPSSQRIKIPFDPMAWVDVLTLLPLCLRLTMGASSISGTSAALGALRMLKLTRYFHHSRLVGDVLRRSAPALIVPAWLLMMVCCCLGGFFYAVEYDADKVDDEPHISSMGDAVWAMYVTVTTVGYGDCAPQRKFEPCTP